MLIFKEKVSFSDHIRNLVADKKKIGFTPTMGALHKGHISLIEKSVDENDISVCSIFVNPTQFDDPEDLAAYPRPVEEDIKMLALAGCDVLFLPDKEEIYPEGEGVLETYDLGYLETVLEGEFRNGHFQGVAQIVLRLLQLARPDNMYIGQKDYQQCLVLKKVINQNPDSVNLHIIPTLREQDGLAMSSRNGRLTEPQRAVAGLIYQCLVSIQTKKGMQDFSIVKKECADILTKKGLTPEYIELADADTLALLDNYDSNRKMVALIAAKIGEVRLIDNVLIS